MEAVSVKYGVWKRTSTFGGIIEKFCEALKEGKSFAFFVTTIPKNFIESCF